jgi:LAS superfamily LD-carboxypeptidase LdcB
MADAAAKEGLPLKVNTAFRSMEHQKRLFQAYVKALAAYERKERLNKPAKVAKPGFSTHQSGISVDINRANGDDLSTAVPDSPTDKWLAANAARFGFVNDVKSEPWHWTYNGKH